MNPKALGCSIRAYLELVDWSNEVFQTVATHPHSILVSPNMAYMAYE